MRNLQQLLSLLFLLAFFQPSLVAQHLEWVKKIHSNADVIGTQIHINALGNVHALGEVEGTKLFENGPVFPSFSSCSFDPAINDDIRFDLTYSPDGTSINQSYQCPPNGYLRFAFDELDNEYSISNFVDGCPASHTSVMVTGPGWELILGDDCEKDFMRAIKWGADGKLYVSWKRATTHHEYAQYLTCISSSGSELWTHTIGEVITPGAISVFNVFDFEITPLGDVIFIGFAEERAVAFGIDTIAPDSFQWHSSVGAPDTRTAVLGKLSASGTYDWIKSMPLAGWSHSLLKLDDDGNIYLAADYPFLTLEMEGGISLEFEDTQTLVAAKLDADGVPIWVQQVADSYCIDNTLFKMEISDDGSLFLAGHYTSAYCDLMQINGSTLPSHGGNSDNPLLYSDIYVIGINNRGTVQWSTSFGGYGWDLISDLNIGPDQAVYVLGSFEGSVMQIDGDTSILHSGDGYNTFLAKLHSEITGVSEPGLGFEVLGNPFTDQVRVKTENEGIGLVDVKIRDTFGRLLQENTFHIAQQERVISGLSHLATGIYFFHFESGNKVQVEKLLHIKE